MIPDRVRGFQPNERFVLFLFGPQVRRSELLRADFDIGIAGPARVGPVLQAAIHDLLRRLDAA